MASAYTYIMCPAAHPKKRRHHTVPRFHLMRFANSDGQLVRVELPGTHRHLLSARDATVVHDFYLAEDKDGNLVDAMENLLAEIEAPAASAIRQVVDEQAWPMPANARIAIATWAAAQHLRTPAVRRAGNDIADTLLKLQIAAGGKPELRRALEAQAGAPVTDVEVDETWELMTDFDDYQVQTHPNEHLRLMAELLPGMHRCSTTGCGLWSDFNAGDSSPPTRRSRSYLLMITLNIWVSD